MVPCLRTSNWLPSPLTGLSFSAGDRFGRVGFDGDPNPLACDNIDLFLFHTGRADSGIRHGPYYLGKGNKCEKEVNARNKIFYTGMYSNFFTSGLAKRHVPQFRLLMLRNGYLELSTIIQIESIELISSDFKAELPLSMKRHNT